MLKKLFATLLIIFLMAAGGAVYLHHHGLLASYAPQLDAVIRKLDQQVSAGWKKTTPMRQAVQEMIPKLFPVEKLRKYLPGLPENKKPPPQGHEGRSHVFNLFPGSEAPSGNAPETLYTWVDKRGVRHFSTQRPTGDAFNVDIVKR